MNEMDLSKYIDTARGAGATGVKVIDPATVVTAPWVRWKCQYGCGGYGRSHCCPPDTPDDRDTRRLLDGYRRALLFHLEAPHGSRRTELRRKFFADLVNLEGTVFKDGFYKALILISGPCRLCEACAKGKGEPCTFSHQARPSMEGCGIDVFQTARNNGFFIETLSEKTETQNLYSLLLVD